MAEMGMYYPLPEEGIVRAFIERVQKGLKEALAQPGPTLTSPTAGRLGLVLFAGHSGPLLSTVPNCTPVHFVQEQGKWVAKTF